MIASGKHLTFSLVGERLHFGDYVSRDMCRHLLEHHLTVFAPDLASHGITLSYQGEDLLEGQAVWAAFHTSLHTRLTQIEQNCVCAHHVELSDKECTSAERQRLIVLAIVLIEYELAEFISALHNLGRLDVDTVKGRFCNLIGCLEHVGRRP